MFFSCWIDWNNLIRSTILLSTDRILTKTLRHNTDYLPGSFSQERQANPFFAFFFLNLVSGGRSTVASDLNIRTPLPLPSNSPPTLSHAEQSGSQPCAHSNLFTIQVDFNGSLRIDPNQSPQKPKEISSQYNVCIRLISRGWGRPGSPCCD